MNDAEMSQASSERASCCESDDSDDTLTVLRIEFNTDLGVGPHVTFWVVQPDEDAATKTEDAYAAFRSVPGVVNVTVDAQQYAPIPF